MKPSVEALQLLPGLLSQASGAVQAAAGLVRGQVDRLLGSVQLPSVDPGALLEASTSALGRIGEALRGAAGGAVKLAATALGQVPQILGSTAQQALEHASQALSQVPQALGDAARGAVKLAGEAADLLGGLLHRVVDQLLGAVSGIVDSAAAAFLAGSAAIAGVLRDLLTVDVSKALEVYRRSVELSRELLKPG